MKERERERERERETRRANYLPSTEPLDQSESRFTLQIRTKMKKESGREWRGISLLLFLCHVFAVHSRGDRWLFEVCTCAKYNDKAIIIADIRLALFRHSFKFLSLVRCARSILLVCCLDHVPSNKQKTAIIRAQKPYASFESLIAQSCLTLFSLSSLLYRHAYELADAINNRQCTETDL